MVTYRTTFLIALSKRAPRHTITSAESRTLGCLWGMGKRRNEFEYNVKFCMENERRLQDIQLLLPG
ncbi:predicted protein [Botrytis cinerea T4]|uniref:Uncharacterized protein n=1 Tax=Botryotinia fuckeliana (strain T4) TaxID=999810 RepID=G2Y9G5_BOTF4|nr:predicted protein [Botrytis cinerea T4]